MSAGACSTRDCPWVSAEGITRRASVVTALSSTASTSPMASPRLSRTLINSTTR